jgi:hypothetical protein
MDIDTFLSTESQAWAAFGGRFKGLSDATLAEPGACGDWSPRDVLVHIACWHRWMSDRLNNYASGFAKIEPFSDADVDTMNAEFIDRFKDWPVHAVLVLSRDAHTRGVVAIRGSSFRGFDDTWEKVILANTTEHYAEHDPGMEAFIKAHT